MRVHTPRSLLACTTVRHAVVVERLLQADFRFDAAHARDVARRRVLHHEEIAALRTARRCPASVRRARSTRAASASRSGLNVVSAGAGLVRERDERVHVPGLHAAYNDHCSSPECQMQRHATHRILCVHAERLAHRRGSVGAVGARRRQCRQRARNDCAPLRRDEIRRAGLRRAFVHRARSRCVVTDAQRILTATVSTGPRIEDIDETVGLEALFQTECRTRAARLRLARPARACASAGSSGT